jgi:hypothetical protein
VGGEERTSIDSDLDARASAKVMRLRLLPTNPTPKSQLKKYNLPCILCGAEIDGNHLSLPKIPSGAQFEQELASLANWREKKRACDMNFKWFGLCSRSKNPPIHRSRRRRAGRGAWSNALHRVRIRRRGVRRDDANYRLAVWRRLFRTWLAGSRERRGNPYRAKDGCGFDGSSRHRKARRGADGAR